MEGVEQPSVPVPSESVPAEQPSAVEPSEATPADTSSAISPPQQPAAGAQGAETLNLDDLDSLVGRLPEPVIARLRAAREIEQQLNEFKARPVTEGVSKEELRRIAEEIVNPKTLEQVKALKAERLELERKAQEAEERARKAEEARQAAIDARVNEFVQRNSDVFDNERRSKQFEFFVTRGVPPETAVQAARQSTRVVADLINAVALGEDYNQAYARISRRYMIEDDIEAPVTPSLATGDSRIPREQIKLENLALDDADSWQALMLTAARGGR